ncbi:hypothetical protein Pcinc_016231 [Petrolisthes cinctipes]|uniref:Ig-like domain-containing protein n=1 Tax=Petrolisthes cinctipes TaxID=88211 RepID=A0AAE1KPQ0_PETCI|nr:hypothetical protein Pcinc_016231 [Petrolisthes cinctipes]
MGVAGDGSVLVFILLILASAALTPPTDELSDGVTREKVKKGHPAPLFHPDTPSNVSTQLGAHAYLPCRIKNLGDRSVAWIRNRDSHILTVDRYTFISDERFTAWHEADTQTWTLQVRYVQERDAGSYECQVSTEPKMSHFVYLNVVSPSVTIVGESDLYVKSGSTVSLRCVIANALQQPAFIFWYHGDERVVGRTDRVVFLERKSADTSISTLTIPSLTLADSGNYTCSPASLRIVSVTIHVLSGEHPAAMQRGSAALPSHGLLLALATSLLWLLEGAT